ncbi:MAG: EAL domain-containing protein [Pseudomonadota bacterium]
MSHRRDITVSGETFGIVASTLGLCHQLGLTVVAEGVERAEELAWLRAHNCNAAQGYFFSRPVPYMCEEIIQKTRRRWFASALARLSQGRLSTPLNWQ